MTALEDPKVCVPIPLSFLLGKEHSQILHMFSSAVDAGP